MGTFALSVASRGSTKSSTNLPHERGPLRNNSILNPTRENFSNFREISIAKSTSLHWPHRRLGWERIYRPLVEHKTLILTEHSFTAQVFRHELLLQ
jgi:hypothetical protein